MHFSILMEDFPEKKAAPQEANTKLNADLDNAPAGSPEQGLSLAQPERPPFGINAQGSIDGKTNPSPGRKSSSFSVLSLVKRPKRSSTIVHNVEGTIY